MRLSRLRLNGFKSFVDPTELVIADGLTGVVGPNGCGKSNLLEALRWVMGENRASAMRGDGMEDVIFAGAASRPARAFAEVTVTIDNSDRRAPAGFNDADGFEVVRRISRNAGSSYKAGGRDVRARDVQMLFADASTGAHSPALVRQGQIAELISAKPRARRAILEEAAGISGLYQRRHEAELKLKGTETNLERLQDVLEAQAVQLATLARQARQAQKYREIGADLRHHEGLLLYRRWHDADSQRRAARDAAATSAAAAVAAERDATAAARQREDSEGALAPLREEVAIAAAQHQQLEVRLAQLKDQRARADESIGRLRGRIGHLTRDADREEALNGDADGTIARLTQEADDLTAQDAGQNARIADANAKAQEAEALLSAREADLARLTEHTAELTARHHAARRQRDDARKAAERAQAESARVSQEFTVARQTAEAATADVAAGTATLHRCESRAEVAARTLAALASRRGDLEREESAARSARAAAAAEVAALQAELQTLDRALAAHSRGTTKGGKGQDRLHPLLDRIEVAPGYEAALGAALGEDLSVPEITAEDDVPGWIVLPDAQPRPALPTGAVPLSDHVTGPAALTRRLCQIGCVARDSGAALQADLLQGQRLVSLEGDLWRWDGLRREAGNAPAAALRLRQKNRARELRSAMAELLASLGTQTTAHETLSQALEAHTAAEGDARRNRAAADTALAAASRAHSAAVAAGSLAQSRIASLEETRARLEQDDARARSALSAAEAELTGLADLDGARAQGARLRQSVEAARLTMLTHRAAGGEMQRDAEARTQRLARIAEELAVWRTRAQTAGARIAELRDRRAATEEELRKARELPRQQDEERRELDTRIAEAYTRATTAEAALSQAEANFQDAVNAERTTERAASAAREARAGADARSDAALQAAAAAAARIEEELDTDPEALRKTLGLGPESGPGLGADTPLAGVSAVAVLEADVLRLRRQRDGLGAVNLRAEEDARAVREEHDTLQGDKADLEEAVAKLRSAVASLNREGRSRLLGAFDEVNRNFALLFTHLFGGGEARLVLVESDDPLEAGLEILCQPPGKKLSTLSLLSGGEQTLTAMALIFAVFLANPAPICVLDEVDAPLDDANVTRFCGLLDEMTRRTGTRFLIITHHAITMSRMNRLFGVTMGEKGVSQLVSVDLKKAESMVA